MLTAAKHLYAQGQMLRRRITPSERARWQEIQRQRIPAENLFRQIAESTDKTFPDRVLIDGMWFNPNYWWRLTLLRKALGLPTANEVGIVGKWRTREAKETMNRLGINDTVRFEKHFRSGLKDARRRARQLLDMTDRPEDMMEWDLPHGFPGGWVYDGILKRRRLGTIDMADPKLEDHVAEALLSIDAAERILSAERTSLLILSHVIEFRYGALAYVALSLGIPAVVLYGCYGVPRYWKIRSREAIFDWVDRLPVEHARNLSPQQLGSLSEVGGSYLDNRLNGKTLDLGTLYAYINANDHIDREQLRQRFGWTEDKPIVGVYASNWFDYPHVFGLNNFTDYLDWISLTVDIAKQNTDVYWLFKPHPCDLWYGGASLADYIGERMAGHVQIAPQGWNGRAVMDCVDAVITCTGTAAIEYAYLGKPSLMADRGWFHDCGVGTWCRSREEYIDCLKRPWWNDLDLAKTRESAKVFAGWFFCHPDWQDSFVTGDDSAIFALYEDYRKVVSDNPAPLQQETDLLHGWFHSDRMHYHSYKMDRADSYKFIADY